MPLAALGHSRAFSDMCGESAPAMTQRGEHACVRSARNAGVPAKSIFGGVKSRRFIAGVAEMNVWRRKAGAAPLLFQFDHDDAVGGDAGDDPALFEGSVAGDDAHHLSDDADGRRALARSGGGDVVVGVKFSDI